MMKRSSEQNNHNTSRLHIPLDLTVEILKKLPVKSLVRFGCVSKQWSSIIGSNKDFIDSIVARSSTQPQHDHFIFHNWSRDQPFLVSSSSYINPHQNTKEVTHAHAVPISERFQYHDTVFQCVRGLIGFVSSTSHHEFVIHNPTTRQSITLPDAGISLIRSYLFGYDPFENLYKVVCIHHNMNQYYFQVFTLGDPAKKWRSIKCGIPLLEHQNLYPVYIKGKIYFKTRYESNVNVLMSFDVRSENFSHVQAPKPPFLGNENITLIKYQGKLGLVEYGYDHVNKIWVMEDGEKKQEWLNHFSHTIDCANNWHFIGVNHGGENIFLDRSLCFSNHPRLCFLYYDPKGKRERYVELKITHPEEIEAGNVSVRLAIPDHVENTMSLH